MDLIVSDPTLDRAGVVRFALVAAPSKESVSLQLDPTQSTVSRGKEQAKLGDPAKTPGALYVALGQWATGRFDRSIPALAVQAKPGVSWKQTAAAIGAARFWRTAELSAPIQEIMASRDRRRRRADGTGGVF